MPLSDDVKPEGSAGRSASRLGQTAPARVWHEQERALAGSRQRSTTIRTPMHDDTIEQRVPGFHAAPAGDVAARVPSEADAVAERFGLSIDRARLAQRGEAVAEGTADR